MNDRTQHARLVARQPERTRVERANDQALEYAILAARILGALVPVAALAAVFVWIWTGDGRWALTAVLGAVVGGVTGWWGWWHNGNEEWGRADR